MALDLLKSLLGLLQQGAETNWWGLGCPSHCRGPGLGSLCASFLLGILCTVFGYYCWIGVITGARPVSQGVTERVTRTASGGARRRLAGYAHGQ